MIDVIQNKYNTPQLRKACKTLSRRLIFPKAKASYDIAELGEKIILYSERLSGKKNLYLKVDKGNSGGTTFLCKGTISQLRSFLKHEQEIIAEKAEDLETMIKRAVDRENPFMTGF